MVTIDIRCDISAILAPGVVSPPYAAGKTTVLSPKGIAVAHNVSIIIVESVFKSFNTITKTKGITISLKIDAKYILWVFARAFKL